MVNLVCEAILPDCPMKDVEEIEKSIVTTYKKSIWSKFLKAISDFDMIQDGDKIAIGVSGGKDSLLLVKLFQELKRASRTNFELVFISMNPGFNPANLNNLKKNLEHLNIPCEIYNDNIFCNKHCNIFCKIRIFGNWKFENCKTGAVSYKEGRFEYYD